MVMGSWFSDAWDAASDPYADDEQNTGDVPYARPLQGPVYAPPVPEPYVPLNPSPAGFRGPENPPNLQPGPAANAPWEFATQSLGIREPVADAFDYLGLNNFAGLPNFQMGAPTGSAPLPFGNALSEFVPDTPLEVGLTFAPVIGDVPIDDVFRAGARGVGAARGFADDVFQAAMPERSLSGANYGAGIPPGGMAWDEALNGPLPSGLDNYQAADPMSRAPSPQTPEPTVGGYTPQGAYDAAYRATPGPTADKVLNAEAARQEVLSGEVLPGNLSAIPIDIEGTATMPGRVGLPLTYNPDLSGGSGYREIVGQNSAPNAPILSSPDNTATQMQQALDNARALEGGGLPVSSDLQRAIYDSPVRSGGFEIARESEVRAFLNNMERAAQNMPPGSGRDEIFDAIEQARSAADLGMYQDATNFSERAISSMHREGNFIDPVGLADLQDAHATLRQSADRLAGGGFPAPEAPVQASPSPSSLTPEVGLLPERAVGYQNFDLVGGPFETPTRGQRIDDLISESRVPLSAAPFPMTVDDAVQAAERIGFPLRRDVLEVGTPLAKQQEYDALSAAIDLNNFKQAGSQEQFLREFIEANKNPPGGGGVNYPAGVSTPASRTLFDNLMDAAYAPFGGDVGTALRQDLSQSLNITNLGQTKEVLGYGARMGSSRDEAIKAVAELDAIKAATDAKLGKEIRLDRPDIPGVRESAGNVNREVMQSSGLGRIPFLGAPVNATGRMNAGILDARRVLEYQRFVDNLPDRALVGNKSAERMAAQAQTYANMMEVFTGRGSLGGGKLEAALSKAGPLFTSMRFAASIPQRAPYMVPVNRLADGSWELFGPGWREAVREQGGFAATLGATLVAAQQAGLNVDFDKGSIKVGNSTYNLTGGVSGYWNTIQKMAAGDYMAGLEFVRNKVGPLPQAAVQMLQATGVDKATGTEDFFKFMRPEWWNRGATGSGEDWDRGLAFGAFLFLQDTAKAVRFADGGLADKIKAGALALPASFAGISVSSYEPNRRTQAVNNVMSNPENLSALPPNVAAFLQDKSWNAATPKEQRAILEKISPEERAAIEKGEKALRDKGDIFQLNRDEARQRQELADKQREALRPLADKLMADWKSGTMPPDKALEAIKRVESAADKAANFTANLGPKLSESPAYQDKVKELPNNKTDDQKEVDRIREIQGKYFGIYDDPRVTKPDGTKDWDKIEAAQKAIIETIRKSDPGFATRVEFNLAKDPDNDFEFTRFIAGIDRKLEQLGYFNVPTGGKTAFARSNPDVDALVSLKYGNPVHSEKAASILLTLAPERKVQYAK